MFFHAEKCYVVLCCYSNGRVSPKQVAIAISPSNQEFTMVCLTITFDYHKRLLYLLLLLLEFQAEFTKGVGYVCYLQQNS